MSLPRIHHLIRYAIIIAIIVFIAYLKQWQSRWFLLLLGPSMYLAAFFKSLVSGAIPNLPNSDSVHYFGFLLPSTLLYFGMGGFLIKKLWNERGIMRLISLTGVAGFLVYIHYFAWQNLLTYFQVQ